MSPIFFSIRNNRILNQGYSLIELLIVVAILGVLATAVGVNLSSRETKTKSFVFTMRAKFQQAKMEAVKRGRDVYIDFDFNGDTFVDNGFTVWVDENSDGSYDVNDNDTLINSFTFENISSTGNDGIEIFTNTVLDAPGPGDDGPGIGAENKTIGDGVSAGADRFKMNPDGTSATGTLYLYWARTDPNDATKKHIDSGPYAITVNTVGRIKILSWKKNDAIWFPDDYYATDPDHKDFY